MNRPASKTDSTRTQTDLRGLFGFFIVVLFLIFLSSCGGSTNSGDLSQDKSVSQIETSWHNLFNSEYYSGYIAVMFKSDTDARLRSGKLVKLVQSPSSKNISSKFSRSDLQRTEPEEEEIVEDAQLDSANEAVNRYNGEMKRGLPSLSEETMERALEKAEKEGKVLPDWNLYYEIKIEDPVQAEALFYELSKSDIVKWVHPIPTTPVSNKKSEKSISKTMFKDAAGGSPTPDLLAEQTYIGPEWETGGLNIQAAWDAGITGQGVNIIDRDVGWNFDHEDIPIDENDIIGTFTNPDVESEEASHGTAVVGLLNGWDNGDGVKGIAHSSTLKVNGTVGCLAIINDVAYVIQNYVDTGEVNENIDMRPGDIILLEIAALPNPNVSDGAPCGEVPEPGQESFCLPCESFPSAFDAIETVTELGVIVIEPAGNGLVNFDDPEHQPTECGGPCPDLSTESSGAIMVAASNGGQDNDPAWWTNCGSRIDAYAWGYGVVTAGYGDHPASNPSDPNMWYTSDFHGTSAAAALVGGAVTLAQSYVKDFYKDVIPHKQVYLDADQMRELINLGGVAGGGTCNIGKKPDVGAMMNLITNGTVLPHVASDTEMLLPKPNAVAGIRYDIDKDGRADLISYNAGLWKIDLSSVAPDIPNPNPDNYGEWDLQIEIPLQMTGIIFPVVHDYDSDGDADLALYDSKNGRWYIKYTIPFILSLSKDEIHTLTWDRVVNYSTDSAWSDYSRAVPGDYDGDNYLDLALATPNGRWLIDYGGMGHLEKQGVDIVYVDEFGTFEENVQFLTDQQLAEAPGWAYLPGVSPRESKTYLFYKVPDSLPDEGKLGGAFYPEYEASTIFDNLPPIYGTNEDAVIFFTYGTSGIADGTSLKRADGYWDMASGSWDIFELWEPLEDYGGVMCKPVIADYSGDGIPDRMVKCGSTWKMSVTLNGSEFREIQMDDSSLSLPPYVYPGGVKYQDTVSIYNYYKHQLGCPTGQECTIFDAVPPISPYFAQCLKYWAPPPPYCWNK